MKSCRGDRSAADQGRRKTKECMEKWPDDVAYYCRVTGRMADHLRQKYPKRMLWISNLPLVITKGWVTQPDDAVL